MGHFKMYFDSTIGTDEDPSLRIKRFAMINLHGVFHKAKLVFLIQVFLRELVFHMLLCAQVLNPSFWVANFILSEKILKKVYRISVHLMTVANSVRSFSTEYGLNFAEEILDE